LKPATSDAPDEGMALSLQDLKPRDRLVNRLDWLATCYGETNAKLARQLI
jgi:hypothetical protein